MLPGAFPGKEPVLQLVFVHGFMGSKDSFHSFPADLKSQLKMPTNALFFEFTTTGEYQQKVLAFTEWLQTNVSSPAMILAHSMGGPLSVDASRSNKNIKGILTFDSPFFGLHPKTIASEGIERANSVVQGVAGLFQSVAGKDASIAPNSIVGFAALAALAYQSYSANNAVKTVVDRAVSKHTQTALDSFKFLGPLWQIHNQHERFQSMSPTLYFRGIYLTLNTLTFTMPPPENLRQLFSTHRMSKPRDTIEAHMNLFNSGADPAYFSLLSRTLECINECAL